MYCKNCGKEIDGAAAFCPSCGAATNDTVQAPRVDQPTINVVNTNTVVNGGYIHKSKWVAFFLCFFLGCIGAHRFYVGKIGTGLIYLLTLGLCGIGALIDLIVILCGGFKDKAGQPLM